MGVSEKQSAFSRDRSRAYNETNGMSRWQARATYGDAGRNPVDGIWPPPGSDARGRRERRVRDIRPSSQR